MVYAEAWSIDAVLDGGWRQACSWRHAPILLARPSRWMSSWCLPWGVRVGASAVRGGVAVRWLAGGLRGGVGRRRGGVRGAALLWRRGWAGGGGEQTTAVRRESGRFDRSYEHREPVGFIGHKL